MGFSMRLECLINDERLMNGDSAIVGLLFVVSDKSSSRLVDWRHGEIYDASGLRRSFMSDDGR